MTVATLTKDDARELYWIVGHVEGLAGRLAAHLETHSRTKLIKSLRELNARLNELAGVKGSDPNRIFDLDMTFHRSIVEAAAGPRLLAFHGAIKPQTERYWRLYASGIVEQLELSAAEHLRIIRFIEQGDADAADRAIRTNWQNGAKRLAAVIDSLGERGSW
jgi:DNA-binding GntR family transcriptional regulator